MRLNNLHVLTCDEPNANGIIFPRDQVELALEKYSKTHTDYSFGCLEGICGGDTVDLMTVSHKVTSLKLTGKNLVADIQIMDTIKGKLLREAVLLGMPINYGPCSSAVVTDNNHATKIEIHRVDAYLNED